MMRLTTIGRRSGRTRVAMVGYYPDGPNLVTLAMNGWAKTDPSWNLTGGVPTLLFVGATAWLSHIVIGWVIGDGLRTAVPAEIQTSA